jgi:hypothetical protein
VRGGGTWARLTRDAELDVTWKHGDVSVSSRRDARHQERSDCAGNAHAYAPLESVRMPDERDRPF